MCYINTRSTYAEAKARGGDVGGRRVPPAGCHDLIKKNARFTAHGQKRNCRMLDIDHGFKIIKRYSSVCHMYTLNRAVINLHDLTVLDNIINRASRDVSVLLFFCTRCTPMLTATWSSWYQPNEGERHQEHGNERNGTRLLVVILSVPI